MWTVKNQEVEVEEYSSVDEPIIPIKGQSSLKQYVTNKPHKWGIKLSACTGSSGIVYDFEMYVGKGTVTKFVPSRHKWRHFVASC